jgi:hypothetical protein
MSLVVSLPVTHDTDVFFYAVGGTVLLIVGAFLVRWANRRKG